MKLYKKIILTLFIIFLTPFAVAKPLSPKSHQPKTEIILWHAMAGSPGIALQRVVDGFNKSQSKYHLTAIYKGNYPETLTSTVAAFRAHQAPNIVQVFEVGTATMINPPGIIIPVYQLMKDAHIPLDSNDFLASIESYYSNSQGQLMAMPFNSSVPILYYNKAAFKKAGITKLPKTWDDLANVSRKLLKDGQKCGFSTAWPSWIQIEAFSARQDLPVATGNNGFDSLNVHLTYNNKVVVGHIQQMADWEKDKIFQYGGREDNAMTLFTSKTCPMLMQSSGSLASIIQSVDFPVGAMPLPYEPLHKGLPKNPVIGGGALWALTGHNKNQNTGVAEFFKYVSTAKVQAQWQQDTGYLPITNAAYKLSLKEGYYKKFPQAKVAIDEVSKAGFSQHSKGIRLGNYSQIRNLNDQALEAVWSGNTPAKKAIDHAVSEGNQLLRDFYLNIHSDKK